LSEKREERSCSATSTPLLSMCLTAPRRSLRKSSQKSNSFSVPDIDDVIPPLPDPEAVPQEERIALAIEAVNASLPPSGGKPKLSLRQAAKAYGVPRSTLTDRYNGVGTRQEAHEFQQLLSAAQERILADWAKVQARRGVPISPSSLADHASDIAGQPVGTSWQGRFMERHPDLKTRWTQSLEQCRANNVNRPTVYKFFDILEAVMCLQYP
jgi:helix-turn-helix, Psq domain/Tc5 transposase DNA-binding domain